MPTNCPCADPATLVELSRLFRPSRCDCCKVSRVNLLPSELWRGRPQFTVSFYGCQACSIVVRQALHLSGCALRVTTQAKRKRAFSVPLWHSYLMLTSWYAIAGRVFPPHVVMTFILISKTWLSCRAATRLGYRADLGYVACAHEKAYRPSSC
jgi:hypothetical protein